MTIEEKENQLIDEMIVKIRKAAEKKKMNLLQISEHVGFYKTYAQNAIAQRSYPMLRKFCGLLK